MTSKTVVFTFIAEYLSDTDVSGVSSRIIFEYAAKLTNKMGGNSDEDGSLIQKHWIGKLL